MAAASAELRRTPAAASWCHKLQPVPLLVLVLEHAVSGFVMHADMVLIASLPMRLCVLTCSASLQSQTGFGRTFLPEWAMEERESKPQMLNVA